MRALKTRLRWLWSQKPQRKATGAGASLLLRVPATAERETVTVP